MSSTPNANTGEIPVPIIPPFREINNGDEFDKTLARVYKVVRRVSKIIEGEKINLYLNPDMHDERREDLLEDVEKRLKNEVCGENTDNARQYKQMVFYITVIKMLAADPNCHFKHVSRIRKQFSEEVRGEKDKWEWVTVHTKEVFS